MSGFFTFIVGALFGIWLTSCSLIPPSRLQIRLYELGYSTGQQDEIMSGLVK